MNNELVKTGILKSHPKVRSMKIDYSPEFVSIADCKYGYLAYYNICTQTLYFPSIYALNENAYIDEKFRNHFWYAIEEIVKYIPGFKVDNRLKKYFCSFFSIKLFRDKSICYRCISTGVVFQDTMSHKEKTYWSAKGSNPYAGLIDPWEILQ